MIRLGGPARAHGASKRPLSDLADGLQRLAGDGNGANAALATVRGPVAAAGGRLVRARRALARAKPPVAKRSRSNGGRRRARCRAPRVRCRRSRVRCEGWRRRFIRMGPRCLGALPPRHPTKAYL